MKSEINFIFVLSDKIKKEEKKIIETEIQKAVENIEDSSASISIEDDGVSFDLKCGEKTRVHSAMLQLRNSFSSNIATKIKKGIREIKINKINFSDIPIEGSLDKDVKIPFIKKFTVKDNKLKIEIEKTIDIDLIEKGAVDRILKIIPKKIHAKEVTGKSAAERTIRTSEKRIKGYAFQKDPTTELIQRGWVKDFPGSGVWILMPPFAALMRAITNLVIDRIAKELCFVEVYLPKIVPLEVMRKKGTLGGIPYEHMFVCPPISRNPKDFEYYADYVEITGKPAPEMLSKLIKEPMFGLAHGQCEPFYEIFYKQIVDESLLPIKFYDVSGPSFRYEAGGLKGLERLNEFHRIEFTYMGTKEQVMKIRDEILKKAEEIIDKIFKLEYRIDANIPVYLEHAGMEKEEKEADFVKTYDLVGMLPFITASKPEAELEIASFHVHSNFYVDRFNCKEKNKKEIWTGCSGIGPSRWAFAFLVRYGLDYKNWPDEIKRYIGENLPEPPKMVTWPMKR